MNGWGLGRKWSGLIGVIAWHMPEGSEVNHANIRVRTECAPTQFQTECLLIKCRAMSFLYLSAHRKQFNYQKYCSDHLTVFTSSASFPLAILKWRYYQPLAKHLLFPCAHYRPCANCFWNNTNKCRWKYVHLSHFNRSKLLTCFHHLLCPSSVKVFFFPPEGYITKRNKPMYKSKIWSFQHVIRNLKYR